MDTILNATQHALPKMDVEVVELKDDNAQLFNKLSNMKGNEDLIDLSFEFRDYICSLVKRFDRVKVVLPIGSPAFMFTFAQVMKDSEDTNQGFSKSLFYTFMFAHSERIVEEKEDGAKVVQFRFKKWIEV